MMRKLLHCIVICALAVAIAANLSSCGWRGVNSLPLPGTQGHGAGSFVVTAATEGTAVTATGGSGKNYASNGSQSVTGTSASSTPSFSGTSGSTGSGNALTTISPGRLGSWYVRL